jgi:hypothetical protein
VHVARMVNRRDAFMILVGRPEGKRPLGRPWRRWEDNIETDFEKVECGCLVLIDTGSG